VALDQREPKLPLRAGEVEAVALNRRGAGARATQLLPLGDELGDEDHERLDRRVAPAPPEAVPPQGPDDWAASHAPSIGEEAAEVKTHPEASLAMPSRGHASFAGMAVLHTT
jgi:hypothetical protein